ncbi:hypothetical protein ADIMK_2431 [Marinobacterium lacunae]|uniref:Uncharacterized protein n=1 Tax=Marinobacterium lacunae TaxID=1232683 RepID=A0A081FXY9_9GAMM|nr:hypothetical protein [Marinobacterium lacunae]KEA63394.1 hypothetical protein ADIMK_2431 [Marinobacterium lacunae]
MTLCITYATDTGKALSVSDSLLSTIKRKEKPSEENASFLPSDQELIHQTPFAVKIHIVKNAAAYGGHEVDMLTAIAGNLSLGLQCTLHIEAYMQSGLTRWFGDLKFDLEQRIRQFWNHARDQQLQMSFALFDHKSRPHIFECRSDEFGAFAFSSAEDSGGFKLSVLGDGADQVRESILCKVNSLLYQHDLETALRIASVSKLQEKIEDDAELFIGGSIQGAHMQEYHAQYLLVDYLEKCVRGAPIEHYEELELPTLRVFDSEHRIEVYA